MNVIRIVDERDDSTGAGALLLTLYDRVAAMEELEPSDVDMSDPDQVAIWKTVQVLMNKTIYTDNYLAWMKRRNATHRWKNSSLLEYLVKHNHDHAGEIMELAERAQTLGNTEAYEHIVQGRRPAERLEHEPAGGSRRTGGTDHVSG